jgi:hypothetical protein
LDLLPRSIDFGEVMTHIIANATGSPPSTFPCVPPVFKGEPLSEAYLSLCRRVGHDLKITSHASRCRNEIRLLKSRGESTKPPAALWHLGSKEAYMALYPAQRITALQAFGEAVCRKGVFGERANMEGPISVMRRIGERMLSKDLAGYKNPKERDRRVSAAFDDTVPPLLEGIFVNEVNPPEVALRYLPLLLQRLTQRWRGRVQEGIILDLALPEEAAARSRRVRFLAALDDHLVGRSYQARADIRRAAPDQKLLFCGQEPYQVRCARAPDPFPASGRALLRRL